MTIDAMGYQKAIAAQIVKHLLALKGNQGQLHNEVKSFFDIAQEVDCKNVTHDFSEDIDSGHGRIETRKAYVIDAAKYKNIYLLPKSGKK